MFFGRSYRDVLKGGLGESTVCIRGGGFYKRSYRVCT